MSFLIRYRLPLAMLLLLGSLGTIFFSAANKMPEYENAVGLLLLLGFALLFPREDLRGKFLSLTAITWTILPVLSPSFSGTFPGISVFLLSPLIYWGALSKLKLENDPDIIKLAAMIAYSLGTLCLAFAGVVPLEFRSSVPVIVSIPVGLFFLFISILIAYKKINPADD